MAEPANALRALLQRISGRGYKAYKDLRGKAYRFENFTVFIDRVQGDPFATPSIVRVRVKNTFPKSFLATRERRIALEDLIARKAWAACKRHSKRRGTGHSGQIYFPKPGQQILERTCVRVTPEWVELRTFFGLPARGRTVTGNQAVEMFFGDLPKIVEESLLSRAYSEKELSRRLNLCDEQTFIRRKIKELGLVAFVADGSILPRRSGIDPRPMEKEKAVPFVSPESLRVKLRLPTGREITGMGVPKGITIITGGGYHGKTTLLEAIQNGVYNHIEGDGRELVITEETAFKIRAEDGRRIAGVDISPFITYLPQGKRTDLFYTDDASGSTSMAANIMEALEAGAKLLLIDEDTSATNFMIRDARMQELIPRKGEPIVPLLDRARELFEEFGISFIIVIGGSGDYLDIADTVILLEEYVPKDATAEAKEVAKRYPSSRVKDVPFPFRMPRQRIPHPGSFDPSKGKKEEYIKAPDTWTLVFGTEEIELYAVEGFVELGQVWAVGYAMLFLLREGIIDGKRRMKEILDFYGGYVREKTLDGIFERVIPPNCSEFRTLELAAVINRLRTLEVRGG